jgi:undecaprenol kinase
MKNQKFLARLAFSLGGIKAAWKTEASFRFQVLAAISMEFLMLILRPAPLWWAVVSLTIAGVLSAELFNTSLEHIIDKLHPEIHPMIKVAKDCASAAVLVLSLTALLVFTALCADQFSSNGWMGLGRH